MKDICSIWAYEDIKTTGSLSKRMAMYLSIFVDLYPHPLTAREATGKVKDKFGFIFPVSSYTARCSDLEKMGFIKKTDQVKCQISNKIVNRWIYTGRKEPKETQIMSVCCPTCKWSQAVKARASGCCEMCCYKHERLESHHVIGRRNKTLRHVVSNGCSLCHNHHRYAEQNGVAFADWIKNKRGQKWWDDLQEYGRRIKVWKEFTVVKKYLESFL